MRDRRQRRWSACRCEGSACLRVLCTRACHPALSAVSLHDDRWAPGRAGGPPLGPHDAAGGARRAARRRCVKGRAYFRRGCCRSRAGGPPRGHGRRVCRECVQSEGAEPAQGPRTHTPPPLHPPQARRARRPCGGARLSSRPRCAASAQTPRSRPARQPRRTPCAQRCRCACGLMPEKASPVQPALRLPPLPPRRPPTRRCRRASPSSPPAWPRSRATSGCRPEPCWASAAVVEGARRRVGPVLTRRARRRLRWRPRVAAAAVRRPPSS